MTVKYLDVVLTADSASVNQDTYEVRAEGNVLIQRGAAVWRGAALHYNLKTGEVRTDSFRTGFAPIYAEGEGLGSNPSNATYEARGGYVTTDDVATPAYRLRGRRMTIVPGKHVDIYDATLLVGEVPVFYWPYYRQTLEQRPGFKFTPGYRSLYGAFLRTEYNLLWQSNLQPASIWTTAPNAASGADRMCSTTSAPWARARSTTITARPRSRHQLARRHRA